VAEVVQAAQVTKPEMQILSPIWRDMICEGVAEPDG